MSVFEDVMGAPAWKSLPTWYLVAANDEALAPDAERMFAERMGAETVEIDSKPRRVLAQRPRLNEDSRFPCWGALRPLAVRTPPFA